ncbi:hypothetical protein TI39_contig4572g00001, partial [Zymoseptoria brevis]
ALANRDAAAAATNARDKEEDRENPSGRPRVSSKGLRTVADIVASKPVFPKYKANIKSKAKLGRKAGKITYKKGELKYSEAIKHCKTI